MEQDIPSSVANEQTSTQELPPPLPQFPYSSFGVRMGAAIVDAFLESIMQYIVGGAVALISFGAFKAVHLDTVSNMGFMEWSKVIWDQSFSLIWWGLVAFHQIVWQWYFSGTIGKQIMGIKVMQADGGDLTFVVAVKRFFLKYISYMSLGVGFIAALWTKRNQTFHDILAKTIVIDIRRS